MDLDPDRRFWNPSRESMSREQLRDHQLAALQKQLEYNYRNGLFYREKYDEAGIQPGDIKTWDDFVRIPTMTKDEQRRAQEESLERFGHPYGMLACAPQEKIVRISATSGTTGIPTLYTLTKHDVMVNRELHARKLWRSGARPGIRVLHAMSLSMFTGGVPVVDAMMEYGLCVIPVGAESGATKVLKFIDLCKPHILTCTPSFAQHLIEKCPDVLGRPASELGLLVVSGGAEPGFGIRSVKDRIGKGFGVRAAKDGIGGSHNFHGYTCGVDHGRGMHLASEDYCILELLDPATKESIQLEDGAVGEMCYSYIDWEGTPLMRYRLNDILEVTTTPCECGDHRLRFKIIGRADDMMIVKGVNVYPAALQSSISKFAPSVSGDFRILLERPLPLVQPPLKIQVELGGDLGSAEIERLDRDIRADMHDNLQVTPVIEFVPAHTFERSTHKGDFFTRLYEDGTTADETARVLPLKQG